MFANDVSGTNSGWQQMGTWSWSVTAGRPAAISVTPDFGSGTIQTFTLLYSDTAGAANLKLVYAWFNTQDTVKQFKPSCITTLQPTRSTC